MAHVWREPHLLLPMESENASNAKFLSSPALRALGGTPVYRRNPRENQKCYKPMSTRVPFLLGVLVIALALIALVEVVCRRYPVDYNSSLLGFNVTRRALFNDGNVENPNSGGLRPFENIDIRNPILPSTTQNDLTQMTPLLPSAPPRSATASAVASPPSPVTSPTAPTIYSSTAISAYIPVSTTANTVYIPNSEPTTSILLNFDFPDKTAYIPPDSTNPPSAANTAYIPDPNPSSSRRVNFDFTIKTAYIPPDSTNPPSATANTAYIPDPDPTTSRRVNFDFTIKTAYIPPDSTNPPETQLQTFTTTPSAYIPSDPVSLPSGSELPPGQQTGTEPQLPTRTIILDASIPTTPPSLAATSAVSSAGLGGGGGGVTTIDSGGHVVTLSSIEPFPASTAYIPLDALSVTQVQGASQTGYIPPSSGNSDNGKAASLVPVSTYTTDGFIVVEMGTTTTPSYVPISTYTTDGYAMVVMGTQPPTSLVPISTVTSNGAVFVLLGRPISAPTGTAMPESGDSNYVEVMPITTTSGGKVYTYLTTMTVHGTKATGTMATAAQETGAGTNQKTSCTGTTSDDGTNHSWVPMNYFIATYLPTVIAVAFRILWALVYNNARLMEPFYRLASPAGTSGKNFLEILYLSMDDFIPEPFPSLLSGHSYMILVSSIAALTQLLAPLCSEFLGVDVTHGVMFQNGLDPNHPCLPQIVARYFPARILQGVLGVIAVAIVLAMIMGWNRPSGVYSDPSSIAVMTSLLHHPDVVDQFRALGSHLTSEETSRVAREQAYKLGYYQTGEGMKYGVVPVVQTTSLETRRTSNTYTPVLNPGSGVTSPKAGIQVWRYTWRTIGDVILGVMLLGVLGVVVAYYKDPADDGFNRFFNSETFGPRFILVLSSGVIVSQWKRIEREVRTLQPYRQLASHSASSSKHTILQITTSTPWTTFPLALIQFEFFTALISACYILSEVLVIVVATVPFSAAEYWTAYLLGTFLCFSILGLQILAFAAVILWWRRTGPKLDRDPDTVLGVWTLLAHSGLQGDFEDLSTAGRKNLVENVRGWRKRYWMGEVVGKDGALHMGIYDDLVIFKDDHSRFKARRGVQTQASTPSRLSESNTSISRYEPI